MTKNTDDKIKKNMEIKKDVNKKISVKNNIILFGIISIIMFVPLLVERGLADDGAFHLGRLMALSEDISWTNLKPWIYSKTNFGTGYPLGIFYPDLFLYPFALLAKTAVGAYASYIIYMMCINFASVVSFYMCIRKILHSRCRKNYEGMAFVMALMYLAYPYRLWCLYARMALGECMFFVFFPIIVLGVYELFYNKKFSLMLFVGMAGMVHSHILSTAVCIVLLVVFYIINIKKLIETPKIILHTIVNAILTILCGLSVLLPILEMQSFTTLYYMTGVKTFGTLEENAIQIVYDDMIAVIITVVLMVSYGIIAYRGNNRVKLTCVTVFIFVMCTDLFCWGMLEKLMPFINTLQFPFRLLGIAGFTLSILCGLILYKHKPLYMGISTICVVGMIMLMAGRYLQIDGVDFYGIYSVGQGEYVTDELRTYLAETGKIPDVETEYNIQKAGDTYTFEAKNGVVVLPLAYYKGYEITDKNKTYSYNKELGLIKVKNVQGRELKVTYKGTVIQKVSLTISILSIISIVLGCVILRRKKEKKNE